MSLKRRDSAADPASSPQEPPITRSEGKKPVIIYILILFIVAFLLMALSLLVHQRDNTEALGQLRDSVTAMQTAQNTREELTAVQKELVETQKSMEALERELQDLRTELDRSAKTNQAYVSLLCLQQLYDSGDYEACREKIQQMESSGYDALLSLSAGDDRYPDSPSPGRQYELLKQSTEAQLEKTDPT